MAVRVTTFDPKLVSVSIAGNLIVGFAQGSMIGYTPAANVFSDEEGVDSEVGRWATYSSMGSLVLSLMQSAQGNGFLSGLLNTDRLTLAATYPVLIEDNNGDGTPTRILSATAWINAQPGIGLGSNQSTRQWNIRMLNAIHDINGLE